MARGEAEMARLMADLAGAAVESHRALASAQPIAPATPLPPLPDGPLAEALAGLFAPPRFALESLTIETDISLRSERRAGAEVGLSLFGRPVHSFYSRRFGESAGSGSRITLEVKAAPPPAGPGAPRNSERTP